MFKVDMKISVKLERTLNLWVSKMFSIGSGHVYQIQMLPENATYGCIIFLNLLEAMLRIAR
jgi:hypothetical protein